MDRETRSFNVTEVFNSLPKSGYFPYNREKTAQNDAVIHDSKAEKFDSCEAKQRLINSIYEDDKSQLLTQSKRIFQTGSEPLERHVVSKLLHICCAFDSVDCATALVNGEFGTVPLVNEMDDTGRSALHTAAESHSNRCVELLLKKRYRTDLKTKDGRALLALELSVSNRGLEVIWNPDDYSIENLVILLSEKDLTTVRLLSEKTKEFAEVAYANAVKGRIVPLTVLLVVAAGKVNEAVLELRDADSGSKEKTTIYEGVIREALSLGRETTSSSRAAKLTCTTTDDENTERRKLLLCEIELLQLFGAVGHTGCTEKKVTSPLIRASQAGDEAVVELLLKTNIDVNDTDAEGNSALHWSLKTSSPQQIKIVWLLLKHGARVSQKNKLGLTALHVAAGNGKSQALQVLLLEDPDGINYKTEMKETPLFFAVKNDCMDSAELLLQWGASSEILNLRQRPIDLAKSQDMRFMLSPSNISFSDDIISETCEELLTMTDVDSSSESICSSTKADICKYFGYPGGCGRGDKCFYAHGEKELRQNKQGMNLTHYASAKELKRKIFVGGLPLLLNSDSLSNFFEEQFGAVEEAIVIGIQEGNEIKSRGFGFVTFKQEKSVSAAVEVHHIIIMGKRVEIKSVLPKHLLFNEYQKLSPRQHEQKQDYQYQPQAETLPKNPQAETLPKKPQAETPNEKITEEAKPEQMSWVDRLVNGQSKTCSNEIQDNISPHIVDKSIPAWLRTFKKWLPGHLQDQSMRLKDGEYPLSSLKTDFRVKFGLELDHASLGYSKLSDFMRSFPGICRMKIVPIGKRGPATHMVLLPNNLPTTRQLLQTLEMPYTPYLTTSIYDSGGCVSDDSKCLHNLISGSCDNVSFVSSSKPDREYPDMNLAQNDKMPGVHPRFLQFLNSDPLFNGRSWLQEESDAGAEGNNDERGGRVEGINGKNLRNQRRHFVLEAIARRRNSSSVFFLREFDFYKDYKASIKQGKCFACNQHKMFWANSPCQHLLWCSDCKLQAIMAAGIASQHKCVLCDVTVQKINLILSHEYCQPVSNVVPKDEEYPPFDPNHIRSPYRKNKSPSIGY